MSEFHVTVVRLGPVVKHPNADRLEITNVHGGYPCITAKGDFQAGDLAVYIPVDSVVPADDSRFAFLDGHNRIKARKLRGIFSMGLLIKPDAGMAEGDDISAALRITAYEPPESGAPSAGKPKHGSTSNATAPDPHIAPVYDLEGWRRYNPGRVFNPGERVNVTEKLHGENARFAWHAGRFHVGSHRTWKRGACTAWWTVVLGVALRVARFVRWYGWTRRIVGAIPPSVDCQWWRTARKYGLPEKLRAYPELVFFGEILGGMEGMRYGHTADDRGLAMFDIFDPRTGRFLDRAYFLHITSELELPVVPVLYNGSIEEVNPAMAEGPSMYPGAAHIREGFVVKPWIERSCHIGRVALKLAGEGYLLRK